MTTEWQIQLLEQDRIQHSLISTHSEKVPSPGKPNRDFLAPGHINDHFSSPTGGNSRRNTRTSIQFSQHVSEKHPDCDTRISVSLTDSTKSPLPHSPNTSYYPPVAGKHPEKPGFPHAPPTATPRSQNLSSNSQPVAPQYATISKTRKSITNPPDPILSLVQGSDVLEASVTAKSRRRKNSFAAKKTGSQNKKFKPKNKVVA